MTERIIPIPYSPGDTLWAIVGDRVMQCKVERICVSVRETGVFISFEALFVAPNPFVKGHMKEYHELAILGRRERAYRAAYATEEEAKQALENEGPDYH